MQPFPAVPIDSEAAEPRSGVWLSFDSMTMDTGLYRIEWKGLGGSFSGWPMKRAAEYLRPGLVWLPVVLGAGLGAWVLLSGYSSNTAESEPVRLAVATTAEPVLQPAIDAVPEPAPAPPSITTPEEAATPEAAPVDGLRISSQSWRRGGLGSKVLVTLTLRNANDYAVKDIEIFCSFARRDGSHLTDRKRVIADTVNMKSRRTFTRLHVGFVNINANKAKCSLVAASRA